MKKFLLFLIGLALLATLVFQSTPGLAQSVSVVCTGTPPNLQPPFCNAVRGDRTEGWIPQTRSEVMARNGIVATSTSLASQAGLRILMAGGNAIDAAVAMASTLGVVEPFDVGPGADLYPLIYIAKENKVYQLTDGGTAPKGATWQHYTDLGFKYNPLNWSPGSGMPPGILAATVPAAVWGWDEVVKRFGKLSLKEDLQPAIEYAEQGFPITEANAASWGLPLAVNCHPADATHPNGYCSDRDPDSVATWWINGVQPVAGQIFKNPDMARTLRLIAEHGRDIFYKGEIAHAIVAKSNQLGGTMTLDDLKHYKGKWVEPAHGTYTNAAGTFDIYETTAPSQSWAVIEELNILEACVPGWTGGKTLADLGPANPLYWHLIVEAKKVAYADLYAYNGDPDFVKVDLAKLLSKNYAKSLCGKVDPTKASGTSAAGNDPPGGDTIYGTTADRWGNMVSWINSNYSGFGTGITIPGYGFVLCNRLQQFKMDPNSPDVLAGGKRPYNTITSGFVMKDGKPLMTEGMPGGFQQPQGNMQVLLNILELGANVQAGIDMARFAHDQVSNTLSLEPQLYNLVGAALQGMGHTVNNRASAGGGQAIMFIPDADAPESDFDHHRDWDDWGWHGWRDGDKVLTNGKPIEGYYRAGSNFRQDGQAVGY